MKLFKNFIFVAMSLILAPQANANSNDFVKALKDVIQGMDLNGAHQAQPIPNSVYENPNAGERATPGVDHVNNGAFTLYYIPQRLADLVRNSALCDVPQNGGCLVVEVDMLGHASAYYFAVAYESENTPLKYYRKEVDFSRFRNQVEYILDNQAVGSQIYSQVSKGPDYVRDYRYGTGTPNPVQEIVPEDRLEVPGDIRNRDLRERAEIKNAIIHGCPYVRNNEGKKIYFQQINRETGRSVGDSYTKKLCPSEEAVMRQTPVMTEISASEAAALEAEAEEIFRMGGKSFKEVRNNNVSAGMVTCYPIAKIEVKRPRVIVGVNLFWNPDRTKPDIQGKGKLLCYRDGKMTHRINMEMKYYYGPLGVALAIPEGTHYAAGLLSLGVAESPISLLTRKLPDGKLEIFREWVFLLGADLNLGVGIGADAVGFSSGVSKSQSLTLLAALPVKVCLVAVPHCLM